MPTISATNKTAARYVIVAALLLLLLGALGLVYYLLVRPPQIAEVTKKDSNYLFSIYGFEGDLLRRPSSVAAGPNGDIYVADTGKKRIVIFDRDGVYKTTYGTFGDKPLELWEPLGIAVAPDGRSYVVDKSKKKIVFFDAQNKPYKYTTTPEFPLSARVANNLLFVTTESGVLISDLDGNLQTGYVKRGKKAGEFDRPGAVAVSKDGTLYVADSLNYRVQAISTKGKPLWQYGKPVDQKKLNDLTQDTGQVFGLPASIAVDDKGYVYVVDGLNSEITVLDGQGKFVEKMGDVGHDDGKFYYPDGVDYAAGRLVVADKYNDRVEVFSIPVAAGGNQWLPYAPYALLLLLLPLLLLLFRRRPGYVMTPAFLETMRTQSDGALVAGAVKRVLAAPELAKVGAEAIDIKLDWVGKDVAADTASEYAERFGLDRAEAEALTLAASLRGKRILLVQTQGQAEAAAELGIPALSYAEIAEAVRPAAEEAVEDEA